jgi:hypothetical protein
LGIHNPRSSGSAASPINVALFIFLFAVNTKEQPSCLCCHLYAQISILADPDFGGFGGYQISILRKCLLGAISAGF